MFLPVVLGALASACAEPEPFPRDGGSDASMDGGTAAGEDGSSTVRPDAATTPPNGFVRSEAGELRLDGAPYRFVGMNVFYLTMLDSGERRRVLSDLAGCGFNAVRFWGMKYLIGYFGDSRQVDHADTIANLRAIFDEVAASGLDMRFVVSLHDFPYNLCSDPATGANDRCDDDADRRRLTEWFAGGYRSADGFDYERYVREVVTAFANRPEILAWELINEPHCIGHEPCAEALFTFNHDISALIRRIDAHHLITAGTMGRGKVGERFNYGEGELERLHLQTSLDFLSVHWNEADSPASRYLEEIGWAREQGIASFAGEVVVEASHCLAGDCSSNACSQDELGARARAAAAIGDDLFGRGASGLFYWHYLDNTLAPGASCDRYGVFPGDPMCEALGGLLRP